MPRASDFGNFEVVRAEVFAAGKVREVELRSRFDVVVRPAENEEIKVEIDAEPDDAKDMIVENIGNILKISDQTLKGTFGNSVCIDRVISSSGSVVISGIRIGNVRGDRVVVGGVDITKNVKQAPERKTPRVIIYTPPGNNLNLELSGQADFQSDVAFGCTNANISGQSKAVVGTESIKIKLSEQSSISLNADDIDADVSGQGTVEAKIGGGALKVVISNQSSMSIEGEFSQVSLNTSGMGIIRTIGSVRGNYEASASDMSKISHRGTVGGVIEKNADRMATISIG